MKPTVKNIREAVASLGKKDFTKSQQAKMKPLNKALRAAGFSEITVEDRDAALSSAADVAAEGMVNVTIEDAMANPVIAYVHGVGRCEIRIGETKPVPAAMVEALKSAPGVVLKVEG